MDYLHFLRLLGMEPRAVDDGWVFVKKCPLCKVGNLEVFEVLKVSQEFWDTLVGIPSREKRIEVLRSNRALTQKKRRIGRRMFMPMVDIDMPSERAVIVIPEDGIDKWIQRRLSSGF